MNSPTISTPQRLLRLPKIIDQTGHARSSIYDGIRDGTFPKPVRLCGRSVAWVESEIAGWIAARIAGKTDAEMVELVKAMHAARTASREMAA